MFSFVLFLIFVVLLPPSSAWSIPTGEFTPMATAAQIEANRVNAQKSTEPRTDKERDGNNFPIFLKYGIKSLDQSAIREECNMDTYAPRIERMMKRLYDSLAEDDRRRYAAIESTKLGHGGVEYISSVLQCDPKTIRRGLAELEETADLDTSRVRKKGVDAKN